MALEPSQTGHDTDSVSSKDSPFQLKMSQEELKGEDCDDFDLAKGRIDSDKNVVKEPRETDGADSPATGRCERQLSVDVKQSTNDSELSSKSEKQKDEDKKLTKANPWIQNRSDEGFMRYAIRKIVGRDGANVTEANQRLNVKCNEQEKRNSELEREYAWLEKSYQALEQRNQLLEEERLKLREANRLLEDRNLELQQKWKKASNDLAKMALQGGAHKVDDDNIKQNWEHLIWHCRIWCKTFFGGIETSLWRNDELTREFEDLTPNYRIYLASSTLRPVLIQSYLFRQLWLDVLQTAEDGGLVWAGQYSDQLRLLQDALRPGKCALPTNPIIDSDLL